MDKIKLLGALLCFSMSSVVHAQTAAFKELMTLFDTYTERISSAPTDDEYREASTEFLEKLEEMGEKYPNYEPSEDESKMIEKKFNEYQEERNTTCERLDIDDSIDVDDHDDVDISEMIKGLVSEEEIDSIINSYSNITNETEMLTKVLNDFSEKFDDSNDFVSVLILSSTVEQVVEKLSETFDDSSLESAMEDEESPLFKAMERLQTSMSEASSRAMSDVNVDDDEEDMDDEVEEDELSDEDLDYLDAVHQIE